MDSKRRCSKSGCEGPAAATLTYSYQDSTIVVGPISLYAEPHTYDLCAPHADTVSAPRGWEVLRLDYRTAPSREAQQDGDLLALADAVRGPSRQRAAADRGDESVPPARQKPAPLTAPSGHPDSAEPTAHRGHLRLI
ncbi:DUF3499 domain-containing protein [Nesterenkonia sp. NBAIMH1]|uniref:DUF3499 domain-containing protein n=1 Tax=Nesterenkonia sp. NBAIMH1 TaxID=2600320 RepID=UPI001AEF9188|nr:DUF3499 domain-containing protein [Nesterenkonia sp. NBAIMH1]